jgi:hypothetical protein
MVIQLTRQRRVERDMGKVDAVSRRPHAELPSELVKVEPCCAPVRAVWWRIVETKLSPSGAAFQITKALATAVEARNTDQKKAPDRDADPTSPLDVRDGERARQLVPVGAYRSQAVSTPLGRLPGSWRGDLPAASGTMRWSVDLFTDGTFQLRQTALDQPIPNSFDDIGRWWLEPGSNRLVL